MSPKLIVTQVIEISKDVRLDVPKSVNLTLELILQGTGNFTEYITDENDFDSDKLAHDLLGGIISIIGANNA